MYHSRAVHGGGAIAETPQHDKKKQTSSNSETFLAGNSFARYRMKRKRCKYVTAPYFDIGQSDKPDAKEFAKIADRMRNCGGVIPVDVYDTGHRMMGRGVRFCGCRLCNGCQSLKADYMFRKVLAVVEEVRSRQPELVPLFLTFTVPNRPYAELAAALEEMQRGRHRLRNRKDHISRLLQDAFWQLETTVNAETRTFHPHYHVLTFVPKSYFKSADYVSQRELQATWEEAMGLPMCIVDMRRVNANKIEELRRAIREVTKYITKDGSLDDLERRTADEAVDIVGGLHRGLKGKRAYSFTGLLRKVKRELGIKEADEADMEEVAREDDASLMPPPEAKVIRREMWRAVGFTGNYMMMYARRVENGVAGDIIDEDRGKPSG